MSDDEQDEQVHRVEYTSTRLVRQRERRWIEVDDAELASINDARVQGADALRVRLDDLWENAWNSGTAYGIGQPDDDEPLRPGDDERAILDAVQLPDGPVDLTATPGSAPVGESAKDVHTEHCCAVHGCKYDRRQECTVVAGTRQSFPCEECDEDGVLWSVSELDAADDGAAAVSAAGVVAQRRGGAWLVAGSAQPATSEQLLAGQYVRVVSRG